MDAVRQAVQNFQHVSMVVLVSQEINNLIDLLISQHNINHHIKIQQKQDLKQTKSNGEALQIVDFLLIMYC